MHARAVTPRRTMRAIGLALTLALLATSLAVGADSPAGDRAGAWPSSWRLYRLATGSQVHDVIGDVGCGSGYCDVSSGGSGGSSSVYFASDGTNVFFRLRVKADPRDPSHGGFRSTAFVIQIAVNRTLVAAVGLDGKPARRDFVYVSNAAGTTYSEVYAHPFDNSGGELSAGARAFPDGTGHYFVDWQVPLARITARSGGLVTGSTPVQLFFGTSQAANLAVINKDYMVGNSVDFGLTETVVFVPPATTAIPPRTPAPPPPRGAVTPPPATTSGQPPASGTPPISMSDTATGQAPPALAPVLAVLLGMATAAMRPRRGVPSARATARAQGGPVGTQ